MNSQAIVSNSRKARAFQKGNYFTSFRRTKLLIDYTSKGFGDFHIFAF